MTEPDGPLTPDDFLRADPRALKLLSDADPATWKAFEAVWKPSGIPCTQALLRAMVTPGNLESWVSRLKRAFVLPQREQIPAFRRWFSAAVVHHAPPEDLESLRLLGVCIWHFVEDDSVTRARALIAAIEALPASFEPRSFIGHALAAIPPEPGRPLLFQFANALLAGLDALPQFREHPAFSGRDLGPVVEDPAKELRWQLGNALLALAWHADDDGDHTTTLAAAERAEQVFAALGEERWRAQASRFRAGALFRLRRIDEALAVLDAAFAVAVILAVEDRSSRRDDPGSYFSTFLLRERDPVDRALENAALEALSATEHAERWVRALGEIARTTGHPVAAERHAYGEQLRAAGKAIEEAEAAQRRADGEDLPGPFR